MPESDARNVPLLVLLLLKRAAVEISDRGSDRGDQRPWVRPTRSVTVGQTKEINDRGSDR